jgi:ComEC/Rec2-related protein
VPLIFLYVVLTGGRASAVRAALMLSLYLVARVVGRDRPLVTAVTASFLILFIYNPMFIMNPGFQLTYLAMGGIVVILILYRGVEDRLLPSNLVHKYRLRKWLRGFYIWLFISLLLPIFLWPWVGFRFHRISLIAPISNLVLTPLASVIITGGFIWSLMASITSLPCRLLSMPVFLLSKLFLKGVCFLGTAGLFPWVPSILSLFLLVVVVSLLLLHLSKHRISALIPVVAFLLFFAVRGAVTTRDGVTELTKGSTPVLLCRCSSLSCLLMPPVSPYLLDRCVMPGLMKGDVVNLDVAVITTSSLRARKDIGVLRGVVSGEVIVPLQLYLALKKGGYSSNMRPLLREETVGCFKIRPGGDGRILASLDDYYARLNQCSTWHKVGSKVRVGRGGPIRR